MFPGDTQPHMSVYEYYLYLKSYNGIADVEIGTLKRRLLRRDTLLISIYDRVERSIYSAEQLQSSDLKEFIYEHYTIVGSGDRRNVVQKIRPGNYAKDKILSLRRDEKFQRRRFRSLFLCSNGAPEDLRECMTVYKLSKKEIEIALKHQTWVAEKALDDEAAEGNVSSGQAVADNRILILKRFDIYFSLSDLVRIVYAKD